jgi:hypothetical protein
MTHFGKLLVAALGALSLVALGSATVLAHDGHGDTHSILEFNSMTPVSGAAVGAPTDRHITGAGKPWVITSGTGEVDRNGHIQVTVKGLVLAASGTNPIAFFRATVSCVTRHGVVNVTTDQFAASMPGGDATFEGRVALPHRCKDPILFVVNGNPSLDGTFAWFAMSNPRGHDEDDD